MPIHFHPKTLDNTQAMFAPSTRPFKYLTLHIQSPNPPLPSLHSPPNPPKMEDHPNNNHVLGSAALTIGTLCIAFALITAFNLQYLFTATIPFILVGTALILYGKHVRNKGVVEKGALPPEQPKAKRSPKLIIVVSKHGVFTGENRRERRVKEKRAKNRYA